MSARARFDAYVSRYIKAFVGYELLLCGNKDLAQDLTQEAILRMWKAWPREGEHTRSYAYKTLYSVFVDHYRKTTDRSVRIEHSIDMSDDSAISAATPDAAEVTEDKCEDVRSAVRELPDALQRVVFLRYYAGLPNPMIAQELGIKAEQVSRDLHRAHAKLREKLKRWRPTQEGGNRGR